MLRNGNTDYLETDFFSKISVERVVGTTQLRITAEFTLSDPTLLELIRKKNASYAMLVKCPETFLRNEKLSFEPKIERLFENGQIVGGMEVTSYVVSTSKLTAFSASNWHSDYHGLSFDFKPGSVLAIHETTDYWIDTIDEEDVGSIINIEPSSAVEPGHWSCSLYGDKIDILIATEDYEDVCNTRTKISRTDCAVFLLNGLYLPVLVYVLMEADNNFKEYEGYRWFAALNNKLISIQSVELGNHKANRSTDAQNIFRSSFGNLIKVMSSKEYETN